MKATMKQIELCNLLIDNGAPFELKHPHEDSVQSANEFIKANQKYFSGKYKHKNYEKRCMEDNKMASLSPEDFNVLNM